MACPRCGGSMVTYALGDQTASTCESCGYVGVSADHHPDPSETESWEDALERFRTRQERPVADLDIDDRTYRVPVDLARTVRDLTDTQQAVLGEFLAEPTPTNPNRTYAAIAETVGVHPSYVGLIKREYADLLAALSSATTLD